MFGRLTLDSFKHDLIEMGAGVSMILIVIAIVIYLSYTRSWLWLWNEWLTTVDHKKIGTMYIITAGLMLLKGIIDASMMRAQQVFSVGDSHGYLGASHFQQLFSAHGSTMIFFAAMGVVFGLANWIVPLQIGAWAARPAT